MTNPLINPWPALPTAEALAAPLAHAQWCVQVQPDLNAAVAACQALLHVRQLPLPAVPVVRVVVLPSFWALFEQLEPWVSQLDAVPDEESTPAPLRLLVGSARWLSANTPVVDAPLYHLDVAYQLQSNGPALQAGALALARATHMFRTWPAGQLKALMVLNAQQWLLPTLSQMKNQVAYLKHAQTWADQLKAPLGLIRACYPPASAQEKMDMTAKWGECPMEISTADLMGQLAYADFVAAGEAAVLNLARAMHKQDSVLL